MKRSTWSTKTATYNGFISLLLLIVMSIWSLNIHVANIIQSQIIGKKNISSPSSLQKPSTFTTTSTFTITTTSVNRNTSTTHSDYAYLWIIGGMDDKEKTYKGWLWTVLISANVLRKLGSTADFWLYIRLSHDSNHYTDIPKEDAEILSSLNINIKVLDKVTNDSFAHLVYDKFLSFNMTQYKRVMFLDADILPLTNLDYLFHFSDPMYEDAPTLLKPNMIMASRYEPCNTGMFMVEPSQDHFQKYLEVVRKQHEIAKTLPYPHFDRKFGWGFEFSDKAGYWEAINTKTGHGWNFNAAYSDQGLMYYLQRFVLKETSIIIGNKVQNWKATANSEDVVSEIEWEGEGVFSKYDKNVTAFQFSCNQPIENFSKDSKEYKNWYRCYAPYSSIAHFIGKKKPWLLSERLLKQSGELGTYARFQAVYVWFHELLEINMNFNLGIHINANGFPINWDKKYRIMGRTLGTKATLDDHASLMLNETMES